MESLISVAIMLISFAAIYSLMDGANGSAAAARDRSQAIQLAQSKINEVAGGILPLQGGSGDFSDIHSSMSNWHWTLEAEPYTVNGVWKLRVTVKNQNSDEPAAVLDQYILDPAQRGSPLDTVTVADSSDTTPAQGGSTGQPSTTTPSSGSGSTPAPSGGGGAAMPSGRASSGSGGRSSGGGATRSGP
jgi:hypothetical protein